MKNKHGNSEPGLVARPRSRRPRRPPEPPHWPPRTFKSLDDVPAGKSAWIVLSTYYGYDVEVITLTELTHCTSRDLDRIYQRLVEGLGYSFDDLRVSIALRDSGETFYDAHPPDPPITQFPWVSDAFGTYAQDILAILEGRASAL